MSEPAKNRKGADAMNRYALHQRQATLTVMEQLSASGFSPDEIATLLVTAIGDEIAGIGCLTGINLLAHGNDTSIASIIRRRIECHASRASVLDAAERPQRMN